MKKLLACLLVITMLLLLAVPCLAAEAFGEGAVPEEGTWQYILQERVVPAVILVVTAILTVVLTLLPIVTRTMEKVSEATAKFKGATEGVLQVSENGKSTKGEVSNMRSELTALKEENEQLKLAVKGVSRALALLACGSDALVENGTARKIMEALGDEGK